MIACFRLQDSGRKSFSKEVLKEMRKTRGGWGETGWRIRSLRTADVFPVVTSAGETRTRAEKNGRSHRITNLKT